MHRSPRPSGEHIHHEREGHGIEIVLTGDDDTGTDVYRGDGDTGTVPGVNREVGRILLKNGKCFGKIVLKISAEER